VDLFVLKEELPIEEKHRRQWRPCGCHYLEFAQMVALQPGLELIRILVLSDRVRQEIFQHTWD